MWLRQWLQPPGHLLIFFPGFALVLSAVLAWISWRFLEQDRALEAQRIEERLERAADTITAAVTTELSKTEQALDWLLSRSSSELANEASVFAEGLTEDALVVVLRRGSVEAHPPSRLIYFPILPEASEPSRGIFSRAESLELQRRDYPGAIRTLRNLAGSSEPDIRAGALLRLGRTLRKADEVEAALAAYAELAELGAVRVAGLPAELVARYSRCEMLGELDRLDSLDREAFHLFEGLHRGRWPLTRAQYRFYSQQARRWFEPGFPLERRVNEAVALAAGVDWLWESWSGEREQPQGRETIWAFERSVLLLWRASEERLVALVAGPGHVEQRWLEPMTTRLGIVAFWSDDEGKPVFSAGQESVGPTAVRVSAESGVPWTLTVASASPEADLARFNSRRRLIVFALSLVGVVVLVGSYFTTRAITREVEVARLQSEFVSAVSHEFRTPLASLRQASELLADGRVSSEARRQQYYDGLLRESERLHRLVESLLEFGRMEAGAREYRFEPLDPEVLVNQMVEELGNEEGENGYHLEVETDRPLPRVRGDQSALERALWNLVDNARKYSPEHKTIRLEVRSTDGHVVFHVRDRGLGIAPSEREAIFEKFVRGGSARASAAKGTGLGLTLVERIVSAHGGRIAVESRAGEGSTFSIFLPVATE